MQNLGKSGEEVDGMTLEDIDYLYAYWRRVPPVNETMFVFAGGDPKKMGPERDAPARIPSQAELMAMADLLNGVRG